LRELLGLAAGYYGRWIGLVITRACDIVLSFPVIILYMIILAHFGSSAWNIIGVLTLTKAPIIARIVRGMTLDLREREYVAAAKMRGESSLYIMLVEILRNARRRGAGAHGARPLAACGRSARPRRRVRLRQIDGGALDHALPGAGRAHHGRAHPLRGPRPRLARRRRAARAAWTAHRHGLS